MDKVQFQQSQNIGHSFISAPQQNPMDFFAKGQLQQSKDRFMPLGLIHEQMLLPPNNNDSFVMSSGFQPVTAQATGKFSPVLQESPTRHSNSAEISSTKRYVTIAPKPSLSQTNPATVLTRPEASQGSDNTRHTETKQGKRPKVSVPQDLRKSDEGDATTINRSTLYGREKVPVPNNLLKLGEKPGILATRNAIRHRKLLLLKLQNKCEQYQKLNEHQPIPTTPVLNENSPNLNNASYELNDPEVPRADLEFNASLVNFPAPQEVHTLDHGAFMLETQAFVAHSQPFVDFSQPVIPFATHTPVVNAVPAPMYPMPSVAPRNNQELALRHLLGV